MIRLLLLIFTCSSLYGFTFSHQTEERNDKADPYPIIEPYREGMLQVSDLHELHYAVYGNPQGIPVLIVHGGPGGGCVDYLTRYFDLTIWKVIMFDQRGGMRSVPRGELADNTPQKSVEDMEKFIRLQFASEGRNSPVLSSFTLQEMQTSILLDSEPQEITAIGWRPSIVNDTLVLAHGGADMAFVSYLAVVPSQKLGLFLATNTGINPERIAKIAREVIELILS